MIFTPEHVKLILAGRKTETRRLVKPYHYAVYKGLDNTITEIATMPQYRRLYAVGRDYAIRPGRTLPGVPGVRQLILRIRKERLWEMTEENAIAEGCVRDEHMFTTMRSSGARKYTASYKFEQLWNTINTRKADRWEVNPFVWAFKFACVPLSHVSRRKVCPQCGFKTVVADAAWVEWRCLRCNTLYELP